jgi:hypothetical protein
VRILELRVGEKHFGTADWSASIGVNNSARRFLADGDSKWKAAGEKWRQNG